MTVNRTGPGRTTRPPVSFKASARGAITGVVRGDHASELARVIAEGLPEDHELQSRIPPRMNQYDSVCFTIGTAVANELLEALQRQGEKLRDVLAVSSDWNQCVGPLTRLELIGRATAALSLGLAEADLMARSTPQDQG